MTSCAKCGKKLKDPFCQDEKGEWVCDDCCYNVRGRDAS